MKVFRLLGKDELELMLNQKVEELGGHFARVNGNTHRYDGRRKYIHFFFPQSQLSLLDAHFEHISLSFLIKLKYAINPNTISTSAKIIKSIKFIISLLLNELIYYL